MAISQRHLTALFRSLSRRRSPGCFLAVVLFAVVGAGPAALAQNTSAPSAPGPAGSSSTNGKEPLRHCWFSVFQAAGEASEGLCYENPRHQPQPVAFQNFARSDVYEYKGGNSIDFFRVTPPAANAPAGTAPSREMYGSVALPPTGDHFLLLFLPDAFAKQNSQPVIYCLDDSPAAFPFGTVRLFNATKFSLAGEVGSTRLPVLPGVSEPLPQKTSDNAVSVALAIYYEGKARLSFANSIHLRHGARSLLILIPSLRPGSVKINLHTLEEVPTAKPKSPAAPSAPPSESVAQSN